MSLVTLSAPAQTFVEGKNPAGASATNTNPVLVGGKNSGNIVALAVNSDGTLSLTLSGVTFAAPQHVIVDSLPTLPAGTNLVGKVGIDQTTPGTTNGVVINANPSTTAATHTQFTKTVTTAGTPIALAASTTKVEGFEIQPRKNDTAANTGVILLGISSTGGQNHRVIASGDAPVLVKSPDGKKVDLSLWYIDAATNGDGVVVTTFN